jgi:large conductance mechanosensitive channel
MKIIDEFKTFISRGNAMDLAVGVIIGAAFGKIVTSVVEDLIMPLVGIIAKADFSNLYLPLFPSELLTATTSLAEARKIGPVFAYGNFVTILINFIIVAFCVFLVVKAINKLNAKKPEEKPPAATPPDIQLLTEIRDLLKK